LAKVIVGMTISLDGFSWKSFESQRRDGTSLKENGGPKPAVIDPFSTTTRRSELPSDAPHDAALQPEVVL
jgi:hypothetical protein